MLTGDARDVDTARQGDIIFYRELDLDPGVYTIESVVFDAGAQHGSARVATLTVPAGGRGPAMSSLVLVNRIEETSDRLAAGRQVPAAAVCRPHAALSEPRRADQQSGGQGAAVLLRTLRRGRRCGVKAQLLRNGQALAEAPVALTAATGSRVQHVGRLPIATLPAGTYELRIMREGRGPRAVADGVLHAD